MTHYRDNRAPGSTYFFTVRLLDPASTLLTDHFSAFGEAMRQARIRKPFHVDAWVVLPNHAHAIWTLPPDDHDCATRWRAVKIAFSKALNKTCLPGGAKSAAKSSAKSSATSSAIAGTRTLAGRAAALAGTDGGLSGSQAGTGDGTIWERHYRDYRIGDDDEYTALIDYLHSDPMRHGFCAQAADWPWSSLHRFVAAGFATPAVPAAPAPWMRAALQVERPLRP